MGFRGGDRATVASIAKQQLIMAIFGIATAALPNFFFPSGPKRHNAS